MLGEFIRAFFSLVRSPLLLIVVALALLLNVGIWFVFQESLTSFGFGILGGALNELDGSTDSFVFLLSSFASEWGVLAILFLLFILVNAWISLVLARFAGQQQQKKIEVLESVWFGLRRLGRLIGWSIFLLFVLVVWLAVFLLISGLGQWNALLGLVALLAWILFSVVLVFVLALVVPIMGLEDATVRVALSKAGAFIRNRLVEILLFFLVLGIILSLVSLAANALADLVLEDDWLVLLVVTVSLLVQSLLANLAVPFFYLQKKPA